jgi:SAM-dependent methyltransferase
MSDKLFNVYGRYYDLLYLDKDYKVETSYICNLLIKYGICNGELLEFGSGTGKHGCLLASHGYSVHGIELSSDMVARAEYAKGFTCQQGDIATVSIHKKFKAILALFHVISYQTSNSKLDAVFANASSHLNSGGLFIFDFWYTPAVNTQKPEIRIKRISDQQTAITRIAEPVIYPNENKVDVNYTIFAHDLINDSFKIIQECHPMRHLSLPEIDFICNAHGFKRLAAEEFLTGNDPSENTWGVCVILEKM